MPFGHRHSRLLIPLKNDEEGQDSSKKSTKVARQVPWFIGPSGCLSSSTTTDSAIQVSWKSARDSRPRQPCLLQNVKKSKIENERRTMRDWQADGVDQNA